MSQDKVIATEKLKLSTTGALRLFFIFFTMYSGIMKCQNCNKITNDVRVKIKSKNRYRKQITFLCSNCSKNLKEEFKMKNKFFLPIITLLTLFSLSSFAMLDSETDYVNITIVLPTNNSYNSSGASVTNFLLNATVQRQGGANGMNLSNGTFYFILGTNITKYINTTINGSQSSTAAGNSSFTFNISYGNLSEGTYTVYFVVRNETTAPVSNINEINSSKIAFTIDRTNPLITLQRPITGSSVTPSANILTLEYTPIDTNFGNCSLFINGVRQTSSTSNTFTPNVSSGVINRFYTNYSSSDSSESWLIECRDLAGLVSNSTASTYNVAFGTASSYIVGGNGQPTPVPTQQGTPPSNIPNQITEGTQQVTNKLKQNAGFVVFIVLVAVGGLIYWINKQKN